MIFVNPEYEKKSPEWKACFRSGKEVNSEARFFCSELAEGIIKKMIFE